MSGRTWSLASALVAIRPPRQNAGMEPLPSRRQEFKSGALLLATATLGCGLGTSSIVYYSFGMFVAPLQEAFQWTRGEVTSTLIFGSLGIIAIAPVLGWLIDRYGPRAVALRAVPAFSLMLLLISRFDASLAVFYLLFFFTTLVGSGTTPILYTRAVTGHFNAGRGLALGITLTGPGTAAILMPPFMTGIIADYGWRGGFLVLALLAILPLPLILLAMDKPTAARPGIDLALAGVRPSAAFRTRAFWTIVLGFGAVSVGCSALVVHLVPLLRDAGLDASQAARIAALVGIGVVMGRLGIGWAIDRFFAPRVAALIFGIAASGCLLLQVGGIPQARMAAFLVGFALGAEVDLLAFLTSRYFGLRHYGFIYAVVYAFFWAGMALGPAAAGLLFDAHGNYALALWLIIASLLAGAASALSLPKFAEKAL